MPYDVSLSEHGDLIFSGSRDLLGVSGQALVEQRIRLRLKMIRGSWILDDDGTLGGHLHTLSSRSQGDADSVARALVQDALRPMTDVSVHDVRLVRTEGPAVTLQVDYDYTEESTDTTDDVISTGSLVIDVPEGG